MRNAESVSAMACPICKSGLQLSVRADIEIDYCPTCRGVWLDRGEIDKIIERSQPVAAAAPIFASAPARPDMARTVYRHDHDDKRSKSKKSFLSELFD